MGIGWFKRARFGMFIHWGPYSLHGRCVWARYRERMPAAEYEELAGKFKADNYRPDEWVDLALEAGMKYIVLCTRQHPGFSLFDTKYSEFSAPKMGAKRDLVGEFVEACRKKGMRVGLYYSLLDWRYPAYFSGPQDDPDGWARFLEYVHGQVRELCTNYGTIDILWYDGRWPWKAEDWKAAELNATVRELQPDIIINNRSGLPEDFDTPEQRMSSARDDGRTWEACMTMNDHWAYSPTDRNWKSARQLIHALIQCVSSGGNLLLDVGPRPDGSFPPEAVEHLQEIGRWMRAHGESVHGTGSCPLNTIHSTALKEDSLLGKTGLTTCRDHTVYLHVLHWRGERMTIANVKNRIQSARVLITGQDVEFEQAEDRAFLTGLPLKAPDQYDTVIRIELEGEPKAYPHFRYVP